MSFYNRTLHEPNEDKIRFYQPTDIYVWKNGGEIAKLKLYKQAEGYTASYEGERKILRNY